MEAKQRSLHKYTRVASGQDEVEVKSMIDLVPVKDMMLYVQDVRAVRGMGEASQITMWYCVQ